jgi:signal transduction histidine kinase
VIVVLLLALALSGALAYEAQDAARSHRATAEGALRDYAAVSAFLVTRLARQGVGATLGVRLYPFDMAQVRTGEPLPSIDELLRKAEKPQCPACFPLDSVRGYFRLDLRDGSIATTGEPATPAFRAWLADTVRAWYRSRPRDESNWEFQALVGHFAGRDRAIGYILRRDQAGAPAAVYGFEAPPRSVAATAFRKVLPSPYLLPSALTRGLPNDSLISLVVTDVAGHEVLRSPHQYVTTFAAEDTLGQQFGSLRVRVALRPSAAERMVIGGLPRSRLPLLLGLFALAAGLVSIALLQLRRERELSRLRSDFVSGVSHELRTPLAQIRMFAETLRLGRVRSEDERARSIEIIDQEARRLANLVDNVLHFSRAERRAVRLAPEPLELARLARDAVEGFVPLARSRRAEVALALEDGVFASVDRGAFRQVLLNLLDNAVKYGPPGQTVLVGLARVADLARVWVEDRGPGIPARERERVFAPFYRLERDAGSAVAGSGIGLAVVCELAALHGGRVWAEDGAAGGARFVVELPLAEPVGGRSAPPVRDESVETAGV